MFETLKVEGDHYEVGRRIGEFSKEATAKWCEELKQIPGFDGCLMKIDDYIGPTEEFSPEVTQMVRGIADGSGIDYATAFLMNTRELLDPILEPDEKNSIERHDHCTIAVGFGEEGVIVGHNEDDQGAFNDLDDLYILKAKINGIMTMSLVYKSILPGTSVSVNEFGVVHCINELEQVNVGTGVPKIMLACALVTAKDIRQAEKIIVQAPRASGFNYVLVQNDKIINAESAGQELVVKEFVGKPHVHTNHYLFPEMKQYEKSRSVSSEKRYERATQLATNNMTKEDMMSLLSDRHDVEYPISRSDATLGSVVVVPNKREFLVSYGPPLSNLSYIKYRY